MEKIRVIGIDPGATTGLAVYCRVRDKILSVHTLDFWRCYEFMEGLNSRHDLIVIEAPNKNAMYARQEKAQEAHGGGKRYGNRMMANAASNAREAELLADGIERLGFEVRRVRPCKEKWNAEEVKQKAKYEGSTNQHVRDAIQLCYGI